jgi:hypothetical protein
MIFREIEKLLIEKQSGAIVTGNPGIGKTYFLLYCLKQFAGQREIIYEDISTKKYYVITKEGELSYFDPECLSERMKESIFLVNSGESLHPAQPNKMIASSVAFTIMAASPKLEHYQNLLNLGKFRKLYMPTWELDEMIRLNEKFRVLELQERFDKYDGVPRICFVHCEERIDPDLDQLMRNMSAEQLQSSINHLWSRREVNCKSLIN